MQFLHIIEKCDLMHHIQYWLHFANVLNENTSFPGSRPTAAEFVRRPYVHMLLLVWLHLTPRMVVCLLGKVLPEYFMV